MNEELFNGLKDEYFNGYVNQYTGAVGELPDNYWCTGYLCVIEGDVIIFPMRAPSSLGACYDNNKEYITGINASELDDELKYIVKNDISYIRVSIERFRVKNDIGKFVIYVERKNNMGNQENNDECDNICNRITELEKRLEIIVLTSAEYDELYNSGQLTDKLYFII